MVWQTKPMTDSFMLCLFFDYLYFDPAVDSIMNIGRTGTISNCTDSYR